MSKPAEVAFHITQRVFALEGETRINLLRIFGVTVFFLVHLINRFAVGMSPGRTVQVLFVELPLFDTVATVLAVAWMSMAGVVLLVVRTQIFQRAVGPGSTLLDLGFLSTLLLIGNGPSSAMVVVFFLLIMVSTLRGRRELVWLATLGSLASYGVTIAYGLYLRPDLMVPRYQILLMTSAVALAGVIADMAVGSYWRVVQQHAFTLSRVLEAGGPELVVPARSGACPWCEAVVEADAQRCGRCEQPLVATAVFRAGRAPSMLQWGGLHVGWAVSVVLLVVLAVLIAGVLAIDWPALLVPYLGATTLLLLGLGRMVQLDLRIDEDDHALGATVSTLGSAAATLAVGSTMLFVTIAVICMMLVAVTVIAFALCMAVVMTAYQ